MNAATLEERQAFLLALFGPRTPMQHFTYIQEKVRLAMLPYITGADLRGALDSLNQDRYDQLMETGIVA